MLNSEENEPLTRVGPETSCGIMLRRYWWPIGMSADIGQVPTVIRLLGEEGFHDLRRLKDLVRIENAGSLIFNVMRRFYSQNAGFSLG